jgi:formate dehydrogenase subunit gamma
MRMAMIDALPFRLLALAGIVGTASAILFHYVVFGPHRIHADAHTRQARVRRFSVLERLVHAATLLSFVTLGVTGMAAAVVYGSRITGWLWVVHAFAAPVFALGVTCVIAAWATDARFSTHDWQWAKYCGGYLGFGKEKQLPAGRFNAGQKAFLWFTAVFVLAALLSGLGRMFPVLGPFGNDVLYQVHRYSTLALVMAVMVHAYLGTFANPGTIRAAILGDVSEAWAERHHPVWWADLNKGRGDQSI